MERTRLLKKPRSLLSLQESDTDAPKTNNDTQKQQTEPGSARKRPQATAAELAFRKTTWQTRPRQQEEIASRDGIAPAENIVNDPQPGTSGTGAAPSTAALAADPQAPDQQKLAEELTIFAQRTVSGLKVKPKPPARRYHERHPSASPPRVVAEGIDQDMDMGGGDAADADADGMEYVYDTYIRHQVDATADQIESVGVLVIPEEDEEGWNEFGSRSESDSEGGGSDDADSNGRFRIPLRALLLGNFSLVVIPRCQARFIFYFKFIYFFRFFGGGFSLLSLSLLVSPSVRGGSMYF